MPLAGFPLAAVVLGPLLALTGGSLTSSSSWSLLSLRHLAFGEPSGSSSWTSLIDANNSLPLAGFLLAASVLGPLPALTGSSLTLLSSLSLPSSRCLASEESGIAHPKYQSCLLLKYMTDSYLRYAVSSHLFYPAIPTPFASLTIFHLPFFSIFFLSDRRIVIVSKIGRRVALPLAIRTQHLRVLQVWAINKVIKRVFILIWNCQDLRLLLGPPNYLLNDFFPEQYNNTISAL